VEGLAGLDRLAAPPGVVGPAFGELPLSAMLLLRGMGDFTASLPEDVI
jgi:hypothetical protein